MIMNPRAAGGPTQGDDEEDVSLLCLDSFVRADTQFDPPIRAVKGNGSLDAYTVEVLGLSREGFNVKVFFRARGDGAAGPLSEPRKARLRAGGREFMCSDVDLKVKDLGGNGRAGCVEGALGFRLDRRGAAKTGGEYVLDYGEVGDDYQPPLRLRMGEKPTAFQAEVARFLGGYLAKERETALGLPGCNGKSVGASQVQTKVEEVVCLPGVPQQETAHDCGFFILEMILRALQLTPKALRDLATASSVEIAMLPWPSQKQVFSRKARLRDAMDELLAAARQHKTGDVEEILKADAQLRMRIRASLSEGGLNFSHGFERWAVGDWDLSPSPSRDRSLGRGKGRARSVSGRSRKRRRRRAKRSSTTSSAGSRDSSRRRRRRRSESSSKTRSGSSRNGDALQQATLAPSTFTHQDLEAMSTGALRMLCMEHKVLPVGIVERTDLLGALAPLAVSAPPADVPPPSEPPKDDPVQLGSQSQCLSREALESMPTKALRLLCIQHGVLPSAPVERGDLVQALASLATAH